MYIYTITHDFNSSYCLFKAGDLKEFKYICINATWIQVGHNLELTKLLLENWVFHNKKPEIHRRH